MSTEETTGAIVLRQPFGGMGKSAVGSGRKAGSLNYVTQFMNFEENDVAKPSKIYNNNLTRFIQKLKESEKSKKEFDKLELALQSYLHSLENEFLIERDYCKVRGEDNIFRYLPVKNVLIRVSKGDTIFETLSRILAAKISNVHFRVSIYNNKKIEEFLTKYKDELFGARDSLAVDNDKDFMQLIPHFERVIYSDITKVPENIFKKASETLTFIVRQKPMMEGRIELLNYFIEQSISHSYHRYGNIGARGIK